MSREIQFIETEEIWSQMSSLLSDSLSDDICSEFSEFNQIIAKDITIESLLEWVDSLVDHHVIHVSCGTLLTDN